MIPLRTVFWSGDPDGVWVAFTCIMAVMIMRSSFVIPPLSPVKAQWWLRDLLPQTFDPTRMDETMPLTGGMEPQS
jgi:hypothetical protein